MEETLGITYKKRIKTRNSVKYESYKVKGDYRMVRYADDFVIFAQSEKTINIVFEILEPCLTKLGLVLAEDKTHITYISDGFDALLKSFFKFLLIDLYYKLMFLVLFLCFVIVYSYFC